MKLDHSCVKFSKVPEWIGIVGKVSSVVFVFVFMFAKLELSIGGMVEYTWSEDLSFTFGWVLGDVRGSTYECVDKPVS